VQKKVQTFFKDRPEWTDSKETDDWTVMDKSTSDDEEERERLKKKKKKKKKPTAGSDEEITVEGGGEKFQFSIVSPHKG
jgi:hypothetical protein